MNKYVENRLREFSEEFSRKRKFGLKFVDRKNEPYLFNIGRAVEIVAGGPCFSGIYRGLRDNGDDLVLFPLAMPQSIPESVVSSKDTKVVNIHSWSDRPALIIRERICIVPVNEEYLFRRVEQARELWPRLVLP